MSKKAAFKQYYNPITKHWSKHSTKTGRIVDVREDGKPFKGVPRASGPTRQHWTGGRACQTAGKR